MGEGEGNYPRGRIWPSCPPPLKILCGQAGSTHHDPTVLLLSHAFSRKFCSHCCANLFSKWDHLQAPRVGISLELNHEVAGNFFPCLLLTFALSTFMMQGDLPWVHPGFCRGRGPAPGGVLLGIIQSQQYDEKENCALLDKKNRWARVTAK